ncbi:MAG: hypothetical protein IH840_18540, partial [Candidatus Heimdallarchaeota archaeon]|nr:hypothetical protein [Candidatus Heimdallarchaeota archaeon]
LPYFLVVGSGLTQFGLVMGAGAINLQAGIQELDTDIDNATAFFDEAQKWFAEGDDVLAGLEALQVFNLLGTAGPDYKVVVDNLLVLINSAVGMVQAISPLFLGVSQLGDGIGQSMAVLNSAGATLSLSQLDSADEAEFEAGIAKMKLAFIDLKEAIVFIDEVLINISEFDEDALNLALANLGREGAVPPEASLIDGGVTLIGAALDVFDVLITPVNSSTVQPTLGDSVDVEAPLIHLIRGALELSIVGEKIGGTSSFEGTDVNFAQIITHLTLVDDSFAHPAFTDFNQTDVGTDETLIDLKSQIQGVFNFVDDAGDVAIAIGGFGLVAGPALTLMNTTLTPLGELGFENLTQSQFDQMIDNFEKQPGGIIELATSMETEGITTDALVDQMATNAAKGDYGLMESAANDFVTQFEVFGLAKNGRNFKHIATGFNYLLRASKSLSTVSHEVDLMQGNFSEITALGSPLDNVILVEANLGNMGTSLDIVKIELQLADDEIVLAATSFSMVEDMPQLQSTADSLLAIGDNIDEIQTQIFIIDTETTALEVEAGLLDFTNFTTHVDTITASLEAIDVEFQEIQLEMSGVGIDAEA